MTKYKRKKKGLTEKSKMKERKGAHYQGDINVYNTRN